MKIEFICPVCKEPVKAEAEELELEYYGDGGPPGYTTVKFYCTECEATFRVS